MAIFGLNGIGMDLGSMQTSIYLASSEEIALREAIDALEDKERMTILLRYFKGLTQAQAARVLGVSQVQISRLEHRGMEKLRKSFEV